MEWRSTQLHTRNQGNIPMFVVCQFRLFTEWCNWPILTTPSDTFWKLKGSRAKCSKGSFWKVEIVEKLLLQSKVIRQFFLSTSCMLGHWRILSRNIQCSHNIWSTPQYAFTSWALKPTCSFPVAEYSSVKMWMLKAMLYTGKH